MMLKLKLDRHQWAGVLFALLCWSTPLASQNENITKHAHDSICLSEVVVSTRRQMMSVNQIGSQINQTAITNAMGRSLGSLLEGVSGISSIQTGTIVSKPVIHGMYGNRILLVSNGARLTGQQWGADHAPEVDKNSYSNIEVVKGADAVRYGSEALGGIVLMQPSPLPYDVSGLHGMVAGLYGTNGRRFGASGYVENSFKWHGDWAWRLHLNTENGGDRSTAHYLLNNTGMRENDLSLALGYRRGAWRLETGYSLFAQKLGVMQSAQMGNEQLLQERIRLGQPVDFTPFSRHIDYPFQQITHHNVYFKAFFDHEKIGHFAFQSTFQQDNRRENRIRRLNHSDIPTVSLHLNSLQNSLVWNKGYQHWKSEAGAQLLITDNTNERGTGVVPIIPNYTEVAFGLYALQKYTADRWGMEAGVRFDGQQTKADGYDWTGRRYGGKRDFTNFTYSLGGHYHINKQLKLTSHFGVAWRAPHVYELYSNGNELSSGIFVKGDSTLLSEQSYKWITSLKYASKYFDVQLDGYLQWINNYIFDQPTGRNITVVSGAYPVFQYRQTRAFFQGVDLDAHVRPVSSLDYHLVTAMIWAREMPSHAYLPYIPSFRLTHSLTWSLPFFKAFSPKIGLTHRFVAKQTRFNPATDLIANSPEAYHLMGFDVSFSVPMREGQSLRVGLMGDNILNREYKEYTNRSRYYAHDMGRDVRCIITWNF
nr:TonB-dependent receptor [uncultured Prevotella sp.]